MKISCLPLCAVCFLSVFAAGLEAYAGGPVHGARAAGMGTAFVGLADDPSAILFNPAGLALIEKPQVYGGLSAVIMSSSYRSASGVAEDTEFRVFAVPHLYAAVPVGKLGLVIGAGLYSPFGIGGRKWAEDGATRYVSTRADIGTVALNPTAAWRIGPALSVGVGLDLLRAYSKAESMLSQSAFGAGDAKLTLDGEGDGVGYNAGILYRGNGFSLGLAYRSRIEVEVDGEAKLYSIAPALQPAFGGSSYSTGTLSTLIFPEIWSLGAAWKPTGRLTIAADYELVRWSSTGLSTLDIINEVPAGGFTDITVPLNWKDSSQYKLGAEYMATDNATLRAGYAYIKTFVPEPSAGPDNPDSDQHNFSMGFGWNKGRMTIDAFYMAGIFENRDVDNARLSGRYSTTIHYSGMSAGYEF